MWRDALSEIIREKALYGEQVNCGAAETAISRFRMAVQDALGAELPAEYAPFARQIVDGGWLRPNKRIFNNSKISDHFAIIPTGAQAKSLSEAEQKIYDMVTRRFLAVFFPAAARPYTGSRSTAFATT